MAHQFVNPLIKENPLQTLEQCSDSLHYIKESIKPDSMFDYSEKAKCGYLMLTECIIQAIDFEKNRLDENGNIPFIQDIISPFEQAIIGQLARVIHGKKTPVN